MYRKQNSNAFWYKNFANWEYSIEPCDFSLLFVFVLHFKCTHGAASVYRCINTINILNIRLVIKTLRTFSNQLFVGSVRLSRYTTSMRLGRIIYLACLLYKILYQKDI